MSDAKNPQPRQIIFTAILPVAGSTGKLYILDDGTMWIWDGVDFVQDPTFDNKLESGDNVSELTNDAGYPQTIIDTKENILDTTPTGKAIGLSNKKKH